MIQEISQFCAAGLHLVAIPPIEGKPTKIPRAKGWNQARSASNPSGYSNSAADFANCTGFNIGLYHGASKTLALDLDDVELARKVFEDITDTQLLDWLENESRFEIKSPKANRGKLLFKLPAGFNAGLKQLKHEKKVIFELRCGNCQDVVLGKHPEGGEYQLIGNPAAIPAAPPVLLDMLSHWNAWKPCLDSALGIEQAQPENAPRKPQQSEHLPGRRDPIQEFNQSWSVAEVLIRTGYKQSGKDRFIRPGSESKAPGAAILRNCSDGVERVFSHGGDALNDGFAHDAFDCMRLLESGGDWPKALNWNADITKHNQRLHMQEQAKAKTQNDTEAIENSVGLNLRCMSKIKMKSIKWLWPGWVPKGYVTLWAGESGAGKTSVLADIVARESTGAPWPGETEHRKPGRALWLGSEDGMADLTVPRLVANGADLRRIDEITPHKSGDSFSLQDDIEAAELTLNIAANAGNPYTIMIIDPVTSYLPGKRIKNINSNDSSNVRAIMEPWLRLAEVYGVAIVCITHFAKDANRSMMARVLGSTAFVQTCRSLVVVVSLPDIDSPYIKGMLQIKNNLPQSPKGGWRLKTIKAIVGTDEETGEPIEAARPEWEELDPLLTQENFMTTKDKPKSGMLELFMSAAKDALAVKPEGVEEHLLKDAVISHGVSERWWKNNNSNYLTKLKERGVIYCTLTTNRESKYI